MVKENLIWLGRGTPEELSELRELLSKRGFYLPEGFPKDRSEVQYQLLEDVLKLSAEEQDGYLKVKASLHGTEDLTQSSWDGKVRHSMVLFLDELPTMDELSVLLSSFYFSLDLDPEQVGEFIESVISSQNLIFSESGFQKVISGPRSQLSFRSSLDGETLKISMEASLDLWPNWGLLA